MFNLLFQGSSWNSVISSQLWGMCRCPCGCLCGNVWIVGFWRSPPPNLKLAHDVAKIDVDARCLMVIFAYIHGASFWDRGVRRSMHYGIAVSYHWLVLSVRCGFISRKILCSQGLRVLVEIGTAAPPGDFETWTKSLQDVMLRDPQLQCPHGWTASYSSGLCPII